MFISRVPELFHLVWILEEIFTYRSARQVGKGSFGHADNKFENFVFHGEEDG